MPPVALSRSGMARRGACLMDGTRPPIGAHRPARCPADSCTPRRTRKGRRSPSGTAAFRSPGGLDQANATRVVTLLLRRRRLAPAAPKPMIIIAQVPGSGTAATTEELVRFNDQPWSAPVSALALSLIDNDQLPARV